ncbi:sigma-E processing peptidase SpoIIGA [Paradesulfitobacterium aromaticivorans]
MTGQSYLDLDMLINGSADALLLVLSGRLLHRPVHAKRIFAGILLGEIPVLLALKPQWPWFELSKYLIPFLMVGAAFPWQGLKLYVKTLVVFWLLSAGLGGFVYALWGLSQFQGIGTGPVIQLNLHNFWVLPLSAGLWWGGHKAWQHWQNRAALLDQTLCEVEIDFGKEGETVRVKALLDTGNTLRDPLSGVPVILLEEEAAARALPESLQEILELPWRQAADPWPFLWRKNPHWMEHFVFIPYQSIGSQSWLLGVRPERVEIDGDNGRRSVKATIALVPQTMSSEGEYQALLHPEHVQKGVE